MLSRFLARSLPTDLGRLLSGVADTNPNRGWLFAHVLVSPLHEVHQMNSQW